MLGKLLKYDMRAIARSAYPMFIASGIVSLLCCVTLYFTYGLSEAAELLDAIAVTSGFYTLSIVAIAVLWLVTAYIGISRYYKSLFTDEGYLNMVLPVKTKTLFNAKLISTFLWVALATVVSGACAIIALYVPTVLYDSEMISVAVEEIKWLFGIREEFTALQRAALIVELLGNILSFACAVLTVITALTICYLSVKRYKLIGSIMFFFVTNLVLEGIISFADMGIYSLFGEERADAAALTLAIVAAVLYIAVGVVMYFVNLYLLSNRFNIE